MIITGVRTQNVNLPLPKPINTAIHQMRSVGCVLVTVDSDEGVSGEGYCFTLNGVRLKAFDEVIRSYQPMLIGQDADFIEGIWETIFQSLNPMGQQGITIGALAAIDTALCDLKGKSLEQPLHRLFGACRSSIKAYASGGLWLSQSIDELAQEAQSFLDQGFHAMKIRVGNANWREDVARVKAVREVIGETVELLADANQALSPKHAIRLANELETFDVGWLEEPVAAHDLVGHAQVTRKATMPIASGETVYTRFGLRAMIDAKACDILMPDLQRMGGLTEMRRAFALASGFNLPCSTHIFTEHSLSIAGSAPNCVSVEHMPWFSPLFNENMVLENGELIIPERPGTGFTLNQAVIQQYAI